MNVIRIRTSKYIKLILVSPILEKALLCFFLIFIPLLAQFERIENNLQVVNYQIYQELFALNNFLQIRSQDQLTNWLQERVLPVLNPPYPSPIQLLNFRILQQRSTDSFNNKVAKFYSKNLSASQLDPLLTYCYYPDCQEYSPNFIKFQQQKIKIGYLHTYQSLQYAVEIKINQLKELTNYTDWKIQWKRKIPDLIARSGWFDNKTQLLTVEFTIYNEFQKTFWFFQGLAEINQNKVIIATSYKSGYVNDNFTSGGYWLIITLYFVAIIIQTLKLLLEMNFVINQLTIFGQLFHLFILYVNVSLIYFKLISFNSQSAAEDVDYIANMHEIQTYQSISFVFLLVIYPYRLFFWLTWFKYFFWLQQFMTTLYRILPGIILFTVISIIVIRFGISNVYFLVFKESLFMFQNVYATWFNFFFFNPNMNQERMKTAFAEDYSILILPAIARLLFIIIVLYLAAIALDMFRRVSLEEFPFQTGFQTEFKEVTATLNVKINKLFKELEPLLDLEDKAKRKNNFNEKILLYYLLSKETVNADPLQSELQLMMYEQNNPTNPFDNLVQDIILDKDNSDLTIRTFTTLGEVTNFIIFLIKIRPDFLSLKAGDRFRILFLMKDPIYFQQTGINELSYFFETINKLGCNYPVLFFSQELLEYDLELALKNIYSMTFFTTQQSIVRGYAKMNRRWSKISNDLDASPEKKKNKSGQTNVEKEQQKLMGGGMMEIIKDKEDNNMTESSFLIASIKDF